METATASSSQLSRLYPAPLHPPPRRSLYTAPISVRVPQSLKSAFKDLPFDGSETLALVGSLLKSNEVEGRVKARFCLDALRSLHGCVTPAFLEAITPPPRSQGGGGKNKRRHPSNSSSSSPSSKFHPSLLPFVDCMGNVVKSNMPTVVKSVAYDILALLTSKTTSSLIVPHLSLPPMSNPCLKWTDSTCTLQPFSPAKSLVRINC